MTHHEDLNQRRTVRIDSLDGIERLALVTARDPTQLGESAPVQQSHGGTAKGIGPRDELTTIEIVFPSMEFRFGKDTEHTVPKRLDFCAVGVHLQLWEKTPDQALHCPSGRRLARVDSPQAG